MRTTLRKKNMGQGNFKKLFEFHNFSEIFYSGINRIRNTSLGVFIQCQYTRTILRNKSIGQNLFKKHSKFQHFDEIFYCGMTRFRNTSLGVFIQYQHTRAILRNENMGQSLFKKYSKFHKFNEILYCRMTSLGTSKHRNYFKKDKYWTESFQETFKIPKISIKQF